jgi:predicted DNA-binding ribbon-helix-helix protein
MSALQTRTVWIGNRRTSVKLHPSIWEALDEVADRQGRTIHDVLIAIDRTRGATSLATAIRVYIVEFLREALKEDSSA